MGASLTFIRGLMAFMLLFGLRLVGLGVYNLVHFPGDWAAQQALARGLHCGSHFRPTCVRRIHGTVYAIRNEGNNMGTLYVVPDNGTEVSVTAVQSFTTMERLNYGDPVTLIQWRGRYVRAITPAGSFDTVDNPDYAVYLDLGLGLGGNLIGALVIWFFGRDALSPLFMRLGWRQLASEDDRILDDIRHGRLRDPLTARDRRSLRWSSAYARWVTAHPVLTVAIYAGLSVGFTLLRALDNPDALQPSWRMVAVAAAAALLGTFVGWVQVRGAGQLRQTNLDAEQRERRLKEISGWQNEDQQRKALLDLLGEMKLTRSGRADKEALERLKSALERQARR